MPVQVMAAYRCIECGTHRPWGETFPDDVTYKPLLRCDGCGKNQRHTFARKSTYTTDVRWDKNGRVVAVKFYGFADAATAQVPDARVQR